MESAELRSLPGNSVVYSDAAWAVARKASGGDDRWFPDCGSWRMDDRGMNSDSLVAWVHDWAVLR